MSIRHFTNNFKDEICGEDLKFNENVAEFALDTLSRCSRYFPPIEKNYDGGLYVGFIGVGYAIFHLSKCSTFTAKRLQLLNQAKYFVDQDLHIFSQMKNVKDDSLLSFLLGRIGSVSIAACVYDHLGHKEESLKLINEYLSFGERFIPLNVHRSGSDELFVGRAGYLAGLIFLKSNCKENVVTISNEVLYKILDNIVISGQQYALKNRIRSPLMYSYYGTEYLGAGHGLAGILFILMKFKEYLNERPAVVAMIHSSLDYMIKLSSAHNGNLPSAADEMNRSLSPDRQLVHWCHGAAGAIYTYARAYQIWQDEKYLEAATICSDVIWQYGLLKKGPGICHGVAGSGYSFLLMYRLTNDSKYLNRARRFFNFIQSEEFKSGARIPDYQFSLFEGWAGTACFASDITNPTESSFPFFDVFD